jgi:hypothetical protein
LAFKKTLDFHIFYSPLRGETQIKSVYNQPTGHGQQAILAVLSPTFTVIC